MRMNSLGKFFLFQLNVEAYDLGTPSLKSTGTATVEITVYRNTAPQFGQDTYFVTLQEDKQTGTSVITLTATDFDAFVSSQR